MKKFKSFVKKFYAKHKLEIISMATTFSAVFFSMNIDLIKNLYNGNFEGITLATVAIALFRSAIKTILTILFPSLGQQALKSTPKQGK